LRNLNPICFRAKIIPVFVFLLFTFRVFAQPNIDLVSFNSQYFASTYSDSTKNRFATQDNFLSIFLPVKFGTGHVFTIRLNAEELLVSRDFSTGYSLYSIGLPLGLQLQSKNAKWKYAGIFIPKINSDLADNLDYDLQFGGIGLVTRVFNEKLQVRGGLYYNSDYWGNFFMPLFGVDWKVNDKFRMYGTLPGNYRFEFTLGKKFYTGIGFRSAQRSFRLQKQFNDDFVRVKENQLKFFFEGFVFKKIILGFDIYRSINYSLISYDYFQTKTPTNRPILFSKTKDNFGCTINLAYRIRTD
jgi:hypothetical protein